MRYFIFTLSILLSVSSFAGCMPCGDRKYCCNDEACRRCNSDKGLEIQTTSTGIPLNADWKVELYKFSQEHVRHPSWGLTHSERNYHLTLKLADAEGIAVDEEVLFAASFLHDIGGLPAFEKPGKDHAERSVEVIGPVLEKIKFPAEKRPFVVDMILGHLYYKPAIGSEATRLFRDADIIDFLGAMGASRIFAATMEGAGTNSNLKDSVGVLKNFTETLASKCSFESSRKLAVRRQEELKDILRKLEEQSLKGTAY